ncbi:hypothetical protein F5Y09DRAFT_298699 [Xylaria sp. FL1042]|nr:hypothetical protein F5Y09DRAFT_298699 [Xylaria sp. FL1042]
MPSIHHCLALSTHLSTEWIPTSFYPLLPTTTTTTIIIIAHLFLGIPETKSSHQIIKQDIREPAGAYFALSYLLFPFPYALFTSLL